MVKEDLSKVNDERPKWGRGALLLTGNMHNTYGGDND